MSQRSLPADPEPYYEAHVFCCTNRRPAGHPRGCCAEKGGEALRDLAEQISAALGPGGGVGALGLGRGLGLGELGLHLGREGLHALRIQAQHLGKSDGMVLELGARVDRCLGAGGRFSGLELR